MDKRIRVVAAHLLGLVLIVVSSGSLLASDETVGDAPNPFTPLPVHKESISAKWRHGFDTCRTRLDDYFKVFPEELEGFEGTSFDKVKAAPSFYLDKKIKFDIYYAKPGSFYRAFTTPFQQDVHANFSGWPYGAELWIKDARAAVHPCFYIDRHRKELLDKVERLPVFTPLRVWGTTRSKSDGMAWIEVLNVEIIPDTVLTETSLGHIELGAIQLGKKRYDMAAQALEGALKAQLPLNAEAKVYSMLSRACYEQRQYSAARNALVNAVLRDESEVGNLVLLARVDLRLNKPGEARQAAERAVGLEPSNAAAHAELGLALALLDDVRGGLKELDVAQRLSRNLLPEANRNRAVVLAHEGKLELARDELKQAIITRPTDVDFKIELGDIYVVLDNLDLAKVEYTQARELAPQRPETHYKVALAAKKQGDALKKDGKDDLAKKAYEEALENAKNALSKDDQFTPAYGLQADLLRLLGRTDDARKVLDRGVKVRGEDPRMQEFVQQQAALDEAVKAAEEEAARRTEAAKNPPVPTETSTKKTAPVIEEPENSEPTPIQVPGPR